MARFLAILIILAALVGVGGYYLNWFDVHVNEEKIQQDTAAAKEKAREFGAKAGQEARDLGRKASDIFNKGKDQSPAEEKTARGSIKSLDLDENRFVVQTKDDKDETFYTETATQVMRDNQRSQPGDLKVGDHAVVVFHVKDGKNIAESITANK